MSSFFAIGERLMGGALDFAFAELVRIQPRSGGSQYQDPEPDPLRPQRDVKATFTLTPVDGANIRGSQVGSELSGTSQIPGVVADLSITAEQYALLGYDIEQHDLVTMLDQPGQPTYSVALRDPRGSGWMILLTRASP